MAWDRGLWRNSAVVSNNDYNSNIHQPNDNNGSGTVKIECPLCKKIQPAGRSSCISCNYNFKNRNESLEELYSILKKKDWEIPKNKLQEFFNNNYYNAPYLVANNSLIIDKCFNLINSKLNESKILFVSDDEDNIDQIRKKLIESGINVTSQFIFVNPQDSNKLIDSINNFEKVNKSLSKYSIKNFNNIDSAKNIGDLKYLNNEVHYITEKDARLLNDFIKSYWRYYESSNLFGDDLESFNCEDEISNQITYLVNLKTSMNRFNNNFDRLTHIYDAFGVNYKDLNDKINLIDSFLILEKNPYLIDLKEQNEFINLIISYQKLNSNKMDVKSRIKNFIDEHRIIKIVLDNFKRYCNSKKRYHDVNDDVINLKNKISSFGVNCENLNVYNEIKDKFYEYPDLIYFDDSNYYLLIDKLAEFLANNSSFTGCINKNRKRLLSKLSERINDNLNNQNEINDAIVNLNQIKIALSQIGTNLDTFNGVIHNKNKLEVLYSSNNSINFISSELLNLIKDFDVKVNSEQSISDYADEIFNNLKEIINNLFIFFDTQFNMIFEFDFMDYNLQVVRDIIEKIGISFNSISDINHFLSNIDFFSETHFEYPDDFTKEIIYNEFEKIIRNDFLNSESENYLENNSKSQIYDDLNKLNISINSLLYEFEKNEDYKVLDNLNMSMSFNEDVINKEVFDIIKNKMLNLLNRSNDFNNIIKNYPKLIEYCRDLLVKTDGFKKTDLSEYGLILDNIEQKFGYIDNLCSKINIDDKNNVIFETQVFLSEFEKQQSIYLELKKLYDKGFFNDITLDVIENGENKKILDELYDSILLVKDFLIKNKQCDLNLDEVIDINRKNLLKHNNDDLNELLLKVKNMDYNNYYAIYLEIKDDPILKSINLTNKIWQEFELINEIWVLINQLDVSKNLNFISYDNTKIKELLHYCNLSKDFTKYVDDGIIDKILFKKFNRGVSDIDFEIKSIRIKLDNLKLNQEILYTFSKLNIEKYESIQEILDEIDELLELETGDICELYKNYNLILDYLYSLCVDFPKESEYGISSVSGSLNKFTVNKLKNKLNKYGELLEFELKIEEYEKIINKNLSNYQNYLFLDLNVIRDKFNIDNKFTELFNQGIFTEKTLLELKSLSNDDLNFIINFKNELSNNETKNKSVLLYNNQDLLLNEINKLDDLDLSNLEEFKASFNTINQILNVEKLEEIINILDYNIKKQNPPSFNSIEELKQYSMIYHKYVGEIESYLSIEDILDRINIHIKYTNLINDNLIKRSYLKQIRLEMDDFLLKIGELEEIKNEIINNLDEYLKSCSTELKNQLNTSTNFDEIKRIVGNVKVQEDNNVVLANVDSIRNVFNKSYFSNFDYIICDDSDFTQADKFHLCLLSKNKLSIVRVNGD